MAQAQKQKLSFKEWLEHIWYYYKYLILLGGIVVIAIIYAIVQIVTKASPDVNILSIGPSTSVGVRDTITEESLKRFAEDYNGDGKFKIDFTEIMIYTKHETSAVESGSTNEIFTQLEYDIQTQSQLYRRFNTEVTAGDSVIYIVDPTYYEKLLEFDILRPLSELFDEIPGETVDEYGILLSSLDIHDVDGFDMYRDDAIICLRRFPSDGELKWSRTKEQYEYNEKYFKSLVNYSH